jgi:hypothetical protein
MSLGALYYVDSVVMLQQAIVVLMGQPAGQVTLLKDLMCHVRVGDHILIALQGTHTVNGLYVVQHINGRLVLAQSIIPFGGLQLGQQFAEEGGSIIYRVSSVSSTGVSFEFIPIPSCASKCSCKRDSCKRDSCKGEHETQEIWVRCKTKKCKCKKKECDFNRRPYMVHPNQMHLI